VWEWDFKTRQELREALESYTAFQDGTFVRRYGRKDEIDPEAPEPATEEEVAEAEMRSAQRRAEIDRCMEVLAQMSPHWHELLHRYYREGMSVQPRGWLWPAAKLKYLHLNCPSLMRCPVVPGDARLDLPKCTEYDRQQCFDHYRIFLGQLRIAIGRLYSVHSLTKRQRRRLVHGRA
jgi:hypothetical protein